MGGVWLLLGPERGEKEAFVETAIAGLKKSSGSQPEIHRVYPFDTRMVDLVALLRNGSLFASHKVVILSNAEGIKGPGDAALLADYCGSPSADATLFLLSDQVGEVSSRITKAVPRDRQKIFWEMFEGRKVEWVKAFFRKRRIEIDQDAVDFILEMVENNTHDLDLECSRLADYFGSEGRLALEQIQTYLYHSREENVFTLFERMAERDFGGCQEVLDKVLLARESEPFAILGGLLWQVRKLAALHELLAESYQPEEALARLNVRSKRSQKVYLEARRRFSREQTEGLIVLIADTDRRVRTGRSETHRLILELFLYRATVPTTAAAAGDRRP